MKWKMMVLTISILLAMASSYLGKSLAESSQKTIGAKIYEMDLDEAGAVNQVIDILKDASKTAKNNQKLTFGMTVTCLIVAMVAGLLLFGECIQLSSKVRHLEHEKKKE